MKSKKISAALAKAARDIHRSDEFVAHIGNIADRYRREHALETGPRGREVRRELKTFRKYAVSLAQWLAVAHAKPNSIEFEALAKLGAAMQSAPNQTLASSASIIAWLEQAQGAAELAELQLGKKKEQTAAKIAAEALRATFEHHEIKWSTQVTKQSAGNAVRLLCAITKGTDGELDVAQAREILIAATRPTKSA